MEKEAETKIEETKNEAPQEEKAEGTPLLQSDDQKAEDDVSAQTWGQWFATKLSLPPSSFRDVLTDPKLSDKIADKVNAGVKKIDEAGDKLYKKIDDTGNKVSETFDHYSTKLKDKFNEKYPETGAGLKNFSDQVSAGVITGYENTKEGYHKFRENVSEAWSTRYNDTSEAFTRWSENVKSGLITGYDATQEGFQKFKENTNKYWEVAKEKTLETYETAKEKTKETYESFKEKVTGGKIEGFEPTEEGYNEYLEKDQEVPEIFQKNLVEVRL